MQMKHLQSFRLEGRGGVGGQICRRDSTGKGAGSSGGARVVPA